MPGGFGGEIAKRPLHFIWIVDCSRSMMGRPIESLNFAIHESIKPMQDLAAEHPNAEIMMRTVKFSDGAQWHIAEPTPIDQFRWTDLEADGITDMGKALHLVADALKVGTMPERGLPPVLVLLSDGQPTDDFSSGLKALLDQPWGKRAVRIGIGIGSDVDLEVLRKFIAHPEIQVLQATNVSQLTRFIKWASTVPIQHAANPASQNKDSTNALPPPIPMPLAVDPATPLSVGTDPALADSDVF